MTDDALYTEALTRFAEVMSQAESIGLREPSRVALATSTLDGRPSVRIVLLRGYDERGFQFFTNAQSRKGQELLANPRAALGFHWEQIDQQIQIEGVVELTTDAESDAYWKSRARLSRIGAWASVQSSTLDDRQTFEDRITEYDAKYPGEDIPRPDFWKGFRLVPDRIEFWHGRRNRLHDRDVYELSDDGWSKRLLYP